MATKSLSEEDCSSRGREEDNRSKEDDAMGSTILNHTLIPMLSRNAGVPSTDVRGPITSHRPRSTIATQLYNVKEPMSLLALKEWLGHRCLALDAVVRHGLA